MRISKENLTIFFFFFLTIGLGIAVYTWVNEIEDGEHMLMDFVVVLATISALIFTIPLFFKNPQQKTIYPKSNEKYVIIYLCMFLSGIFVSLFTLLGINNFLNNDKQIDLFFFKLSLILFLGCLVWLIPYLFIFIRRDTVKLMEKIKNSILDDLHPIPFIGRIQLESTKEKINDLGRITLQALNDHNYGALENGVTDLRNIGCEIIRRTESGNVLLKRILKILRRSGSGNVLLKRILKILRRNEVNTAIGINLLKEIMRCFRDLGFACVECKSDEYSRRIGKQMSRIIVEGLSSQKGFEYGNFISMLEEVGIEATKKHLDKATDQILNSLGKIADLSIERSNLQCNLVRPVLKSLQEIGIVCAEEKMVHQCATARTRILGIARLGKQKEREDIFHEALKRFWVVTVYMRTNIPEKKASYKLEKELKEEFGSIFTCAIDESIKMLHQEGEWIRERVITEFRDTSTFFIK